MLRNKNRCKWVKILIHTVEPKRIKVQWYKQLCKKCLKSHLEISKNKLKEFRLGSLF